MVRPYRPAQGREREVLDGDPGRDERDDRGVSLADSGSHRPVRVHHVGEPQTDGFAPKGNTQERGVVRNYLAQTTATVQKVIGCIHTYVDAKYQELRFGSAAETAFEAVRSEVDSRFGRLVPDGPQKLAAAFENAASENPEHWANAASTCRRLLKATADALRPAGGDVDGRKMGNDHYINRLIDWISTHSDSGTITDVTVSDLSYLGKRLDAFDDAGHKGAHAEVDRFDASRFLVGTYLMLGDILRLAPDDAAPALAPAEQVEDLPADPD